MANPQDCVYNLLPLADLLALVCGVFCEFVTFPLVSWVRCGTWLYRFLIFATLLLSYVVWRISRWRPSWILYVMGTQKNHQNEMVLLGTLNKCLKWWIRKHSQFYTPNICLSRSITQSCSSFNNILGNFSCFFFLPADFFQNQLSKNYFMITIRVSNSLDPDQARCFVRPDLGPKCLQKL